MSTITPASPEPFVSVEALAEILGVPPSWIYERTSTGRIPHYRIGRYVRFRVSEVERWLATQPGARRGVRG